MIRHSDVGKKMRKLRPVIAKFVEAMETKSGDMLKTNPSLKRLDWETPTPEKLLQVRREIASYIKSGMLERKDQELEIAVLAMLAWFMRLEDAKRQRIAEAW